MWAILYRWIGGTECGQRSRGKCWKVASTAAWKMLHSMFLSLRQQRDVDSLVCATGYTILCRLDCQDDKRAFLWPFVSQFRSSACQKKAEGASRKGWFSIGTWLLARLPCELQCSHYWKAIRKTFLQQRLQVHDWGICLNNGFAQCIVPALIPTWQKPRTASSPLLQSSQ